MEWTILEVLNATKKVLLQQMLTHHLCEKRMHFLGPRGPGDPPGGCRGPCLLNALHDEPAPDLEIETQEAMLLKIDEEI